MKKYEIEIILEEYNQLWSYYINTIKERKDLLNWYFKVVTLPTGFIAFIAYSDITTIVFPPEVISFALFVLFLTGLALFITYAKNSKTSSYYDIACQSIRSYLRKNIKGGNEIFIIDDLRVEKNDYSLKSVRSWRIFSIIPINSGLGSTAISLFFCMDQITIWITSFIIIFLFHLFSYNYFFELHRGA